MHLERQRGEGKGGCVKCLGLEFNGCGGQVAVCSIYQFRSVGKTTVPSQPIPVRLLPVECWRVSISAGRVNRIQGLGPTLFSR